jgi:hypothetical protein
MNLVSNVLGKRENASVSVQTGLRIAGLVAFLGINLVEQLLDTRGVAPRSPASGLSFGPSIVPYFQCSTVLSILIFDHGRQAVREYDCVALYIRAVRASNFWKVIDEFA